MPLRVRFLTPFQCGSPYKPPKVPLSSYPMHPAHRHEAQVNSNETQHILGIYSISDTKLLSSYFEKYLFTFLQELVYKAVLSSEITDKLNTQFFIKKLNKHV